MHPDPEFIAKLEEQSKAAGVTVIDGCIDGSGHQFYLVVEADNSTKLNEAIEQLRLVGDINDIFPV